MVDPLKDCKECGKVFRGKRGWAYCSECSEMIRGVTVKASDSQHPALVAEREAKPLEFTPPDPILVMRCLGEMVDGLEPCLETSEPTQDQRKPWEVMLSCAHRFGPWGFCVTCGYHEDQIYWAFEGFSPMEQSP